MNAISSETSSEIHAFNRIMYAIQKERIAVGNQVDSRVRNEQAITPRLQKIVDDLNSLEKNTKNFLEEILKNTGIYDSFFKLVKGIGPSLATSLIAEIKDISKFEHISHLWAYGGLTSSYVLAECEHGHKLIMSSDKRTTCPVLSENGEEGEETDGPKTFLPCGGAITITERINGKAPKRKKGYHYLFNTRLKTLSWKIATQFIKQNAGYSEIYNNEKQRQVAGGLKLGHAHNRAMRKTSKIFLQHLWLKWRELDGLPISEPYVKTHLGHDSIITFESILDKQ